MWYARRFLREVAQQSGGPPKTLAPGAEKALLDYLWPGNVRELRHCIERAYVLTPGNTLDPNVLFDEEHACGDCGVAANCSDVAQRTLSNCLEECERQYLLLELTRNDWQMGKTASAIGISRKNLWERLRRPNLSVPAVESLLARLSPVDIAMLEGFKTAALPTVEVWLRSSDRAPRWPQDRRVCAVVSDAPLESPMIRFDPRDVSGLASHIAKRLRVGTRVTARAS